ncbi:hypothetical protein [Thiocapsa rosea]|uniref:hypothetical protein n=1 Tax=Thiocapsa rosea TaxID=69360 RepID=UPI000EAE0718|nr:hypothetical protein [Thiocapsa rosea]
MSETIAERGPDGLFPARLPAVDADAATSVVDRGADFGLADARRGAAGTGAAPVGILTPSGVLSLVG